MGEMPKRGHGLRPQTKSHALTHVAASRPDAQLKPDVPDHVGKHPIPHSVFVILYASVVAAAARPWLFFIYALPPSRFACYGTRAHTVFGTRHSPFAIRRHLTRIAIPVGTLGTLGMAVNSTLST